MHSDYKELLFILNERRVKYLIVGAYAVAGPARCLVPLKGMTSADSAENGSFSKWALNRLKLTC